MFCPPAPASSRRFTLHVPATGVINVTTAKYKRPKEKPSMSNVTPDAEKTPAADAQPGKPEAKPKKATKGSKPAKKVKATKKAAGKPAADRTNKKAEVIAMMKRAKG